MSQTVLRQLEDLSRVIQESSWTRFFLVLDANAYAQSGAKAILEPVLSRHTVRCFTEFEPNPRIDDVAEGTRRLVEAPCDAVVAIGGGTAIDVAKLVCHFASQPVEPSSARLQELLAQSVPPVPRRHALVAAPTTAGTGSEATQFAVVYVGEAKHSVSHPSLLPDVAVVDPRLTSSLPARITAATGLDALAQALESMWSVQATDESIDDAEHALRLGLAHLEKAVLAPTPDDRAAMAQASHLAGRAINVSRTTAPHALSYRITIHHHVPHGLAVALGVAPFLRFNGELQGGDIADSRIADSRGADHVRRVLSRIVAAFGIAPERPDAIDAAAERWEELLRKIGCGVRLSDYGVTSADDRLEIARSVNQQRLTNNPRTVSEDDLLRIVEQMA